MINDLWYKNAIVYAISVRTYMDANGDGTGDFEGLRRRLDYLHGLGVTTIWLMPFKSFVTEIGEQRHTPISLRSLNRGIIRRAEHCQAARRCGAGNIVTVLLCLH